MRALSAPVPAAVRPGWAAGPCLAALAAGGLILSALLWPEWRRNPDLSHGVFLPVIFLFLVHEARSRGTPRYLRPGWGAPAAALGLGLAALAALSAAGLYAAAEDWSHPLVEFLLAVAYALALAAGAVALADERVRLVPLNWSSLAAALLWPLGAPIPPGTYTRLTLSLQLGVSAAVLRTLQVLGIPAHRDGNVIELARSVVGVEEACSGVRSLISCLFAGIFFSACLVRRPSSRLVLIGASVPLALGMNFLRSLILTLLANAGVPIGGFWHDVTGYAILVATAALLFGTALLLERRERRDGPRPAPAGPAVRPPVTAGLRVLGSALFVAGALAAFFRADTRPSVRATEAAPDLASLLPERAAGWSAQPRPDLDQFKSGLRTDFLAERVFEREAPRAGRVDLYLAYWRPGQAPASFVASHTPDACWPGTGWSPQPLTPSRAPLALPGRELPPAEARLFHNAGYPRYVWFWQIYDHRPVPFESPYSARDLLDLAWRYGFRRDGSQLFVRVSSDRPWPEIANEPFLREFFDGLRPFGL